MNKHLLRHQDNIKVPTSLLTLFVKFLFDLLLHYVRLFIFIIVYLTCLAMMSFNLLFIQHYVILRNIDYIEISYNLSTVSRFVRYAHLISRLGVC